MPHPGKCGGVVEVHDRPAVRLGHLRDLFGPGHFFHNGFDLVVIAREPSWGGGHCGMTQNDERSAQGGR